MTNFDLEEIYDILTDIRFDPSNAQNVVWLDTLLEVLKKDKKNAINLREVFHGEDCKKYYVIVSKPYKRTIVEDETVYKFFRLYLLEVKHLCLTERYHQVFYLIDMLDNLPEEIIKNNLLLPIKKLKRYLSPYWRKYDKSFLRDFIRNAKITSNH